MKLPLHRMLLIILLVISALPTSAQENATVTGTILDNKDQPLHASSILLLHSSDSSLAATAVADEQGNYEISGIQPGEYLISYTTIGFETSSSGSFVLTAAQRYDAGVVRLTAASTQLRDVTISASRPIIQVKPGKTVFNVAASLSGAGSNGLELLQKMPGILIDEHGKIVLKGKMGVRIYVDGRMIQLSGDDLAAYVRSINSNDVEAIEIISAPGAKYDASGNAGVINFRLRKKSSSGMNGSASIGLIQGYTPKGNSAAAINFRDRNINVFANVSANLGQNKSDIYCPRVLKDDTYDQLLTLLSDTRNYNAKAGIDWFLSPSKTVGIIASGNISHDDWHSSSRTDIYQGSAKVYDKTLIALNNTPRKRSSFNTNFNYRYADSLGRELNIDADYGLFRGRANTYQPNYYERSGKPISEVITSNHMPTDIDIYTVRADASFPWGQGKWGAGAKIAYVTTRNSSDFYNWENGAMQPASDRSFDFDYQETVNAAYVSYQRPLSDKWTVQLGLRTEQTNSRGKLVRRDGQAQVDNDVKRSYLDLFPNALVTFTAGKKNTMNLSYSRRIDRPVYQDLNPFELKVDELTQQKGNSFLLPQYTHSIELTHAWNNVLTTSLGYSRVSNYTAEITDTLGSTTSVQLKNIARQSMFSLNISASFEPASYWKIFANIWGNFQDFKGGTQTSKLDVQEYCYGMSLQHNFTLGKGISAELTGWFNGPGLFGPVFRTKPMGALDIGVQKQVLNDKGSIRIGVTDVLRTAIWRATNEYNGLLLHIRHVGETRTLRASFQYNFGSSVVKASRQRETGLEIEKNRIKEK